ncbi:hypothetical protein RASY3_12530 [Ruminococcus albus SY3]|uniref:Uncharacterized protein n=1 Tax=Ruminococcus albus SY3 TaxID=1341156 RepID=A0A011V152_RUMAL|nr:hypothetical protein RASY3_12530 [Ruminococcus albus SY3]
MVKLFAKSLRRAREAEPLGQGAKATWQQSYKSNSELTVMSKKGAAIIKKSSVCKAYTTHKLCAEILPRLKSTAIAR